MLPTLVIFDRRKFALPGSEDRGGGVDALAADSDRNIAVVLDSGAAGISLPRCVLV